MIVQGEALVLRTCKKDLTSHGGFIWPGHGYVEAKDWKPTTECGGGLHGALNGEGNGGFFNWDPQAKWLVVEVDHWIDLGGKVKFQYGTVVHTGDQVSATEYMKARGCSGAIIGATFTAGYKGTATAGDKGTATAGDYGTATAWHGGTAIAGYRGTATAGDWGTATAWHGGTATAGDWGTATAGSSGTATAGDYGTATVGEGGTATAGDSGTLIFKYSKGRRRVSVAYVGENGIKPDTKYKLDTEGNFIEVRGMK